MEQLFGLLPFRCETCSRCGGREQTIRVYHDFASDFLCAAARNLVLGHAGAGDREGAGGLQDDKHRLRDGGRQQVEDEDEDEDEDERTAHDTRQSRKKWNDFPCSCFSLYIAQCSFSFLSLLPFFLLSSPSSAFSLSPSLNLHSPPLTTSTVLLSSLAGAPSQQPGSVVCLL